MWESALLMLREQMPYRWKQTNGDRDELQAQASRYLHYTGNAWIPEPAFQASDLRLGLAREFGNLSLRQT
jgi:hypothetical protein